MILLLLVLEALNQFEYGLFLLLHFMQVPTHFYFQYFLIVYYFYVLRVSGVYFGGSYAANAPLHSFHSRLTLLAPRLGFSVHSVILFDVFVFWVRFD